MNLTKFYTPLAALLLTGAVFTACSSDDSTSEVAPVNKNYSLSVQVVKGGNDTRALDYEAYDELNGYVSSMWQIGEQVECFNVDETSPRGYLQPKEGTIQRLPNGSVCRLETDANGLSGTYAVGDVLKLYYPHKVASYEGQDGTLQTISDNYDFSTTSIQVTSVDPGTKVLSANVTANFNNDQAVVRFALKTAEGAPIQAKKLYVSGWKENEEPSIIVREEEIVEGGKSVIRAVYGTLEIDLGENPSDKVWVAVRADANTVLSIVAETDGPTYVATSNNVVQIGNGHYYSIPVTMHLEEQ
jgi:hypothetical protein